MKVVVLFLVIGRVANFEVDSSLRFESMKECRKVKAEIEALELQPPFYPSYVKAMCIRVLK